MSSIKVEYGCQIKRWSGGAVTPRTRTTGKEPTVIETSVAEKENKREKTPKPKQVNHGQDSLYSVLAVLPLEKRVALIERMAERLGV